MREKALKMHENGGKLAVASKVPLETQEDLSLAYSPGVDLVRKFIEMKVLLTSTLQNKTWLLL